MKTHSKPEELSIFPVADTRSRAAWLLSNGYPVSAVVRWVGVSRKTIWRWRQEETFQKDMTRWREMVRAQAEELLAGASLRVARRLIDLALSRKGGTKHDKIRLAACRDILDRVGISADHQLRWAQLGLKQKQGGDLLDRLTAWVQPMVNPDATD